MQSFVLKSKPPEYYNPKLTEIAAFTYSIVLSSTRPTYPNMRDLSMVRICSSIMTDDAFNPLMAIGTCVGNPILLRLPVIAATMVVRLN